MDGDGDVAVGDRPPCAAHRHGFVATAGTITFTSVGNRYAGSYDLTFDFGDRATGTFDAPGCPGLALLAEGNATLLCE